jgi:hypothetical protein
MQQGEEKIESPSFHVDDVIFQSHIHQPQKLFSFSLFSAPLQGKMRIREKYF